MAEIFYFRRGPGLHESWAAGRRGVSASEDKLGKHPGVVRHTEVAGLRQLVVSVSTREAIRGAGSGGIHIRLSLCVGCKACRKMLRQMISLEESLPVGPTEENATRQAQSCVPSKTGKIRLSVGISWFFSTQIPELLCSCPRDRCTVVCYP